MSISSEFESLSAYCRRRNVPKTSAYKLLVRQGLPTDQGVTPEVEAALAAEWPIQPEPISHEVMPRVERSADPLAKYQPQALTFGHYTAPDRGAMTVQFLQQTAQLLEKSSERQENFVAALLANAQQMGAQLGALEGITMAQAREQARQAVLDQMGNSAGLMGNDPDVAVDGGGS